MYRVKTMKYKILVLGVALCSTSLFAKPINITISDPIVNPGFHDTELFHDDELEVQFFLAGCKIGDDKRFGCEEYIELGQIDVEENESEEKAKHTLTRHFSFNTDNLTQVQKDDPNLGLYFVTNGNFDSFSKTGLLGDCIRKIIKDEPIGNSCKPIRNGNGVSFELSIKDYESNSADFIIPADNE